MNKDLDVHSNHFEGRFTLELVHLSVIVSVFFSESDGSNSAFTALTTTEPSLFILNIAFLKVDITEILMI
jgi:hypothetical protein